MADGKAKTIRRVNPPELGTPPGYSQVADVRASRIIFVAGQTALGTASDLVKLTVFLRDMGHLPTYREARNRFFATVSPPAAPAVTLVEVSKLYGPDFLIEIEAVAAL